jgi:GDP-4-dehydro-6-deoxy-D-mannose reductase
LTEYLLTGCGGFVAAHYLEYLAQADFDGQVLGVGTTAPAQVPTKLRFRFEKINLLDFEELSLLVRAVQPKFCVHLASMSSVADSWTHPKTSFVNNTNIFLNLIEAIRTYSSETRILSIGSSEQYRTKDVSTQPLTEMDLMAPNSPYAVARCAQEWLGKAYVVGYGLDIVMTRSFNHIGPYQDSRFVLSGFAQSFAQALINGEKTVNLTVGDLDVVRDFLHVRDVVRAYEAILHGASKGDVFNVCSGRGVRLFKTLDVLSRLSGLNYDTEIDKSLVRPMENRSVIGSHDAITVALGWTPSLNFEESMSDLLTYWIESLAV